MDFKYIGERQGNVPEGKRHGFGICHCLLSGSRYIGLFTEDSFNFGLQLSSDGSCYLGSFKRNEQSGNGIHTSADISTVYLGQWMYGQMSGVGIMAWD